MFDWTVSTSNDLGLFSEEYHARADEMLGNFPQGLTRLSCISATIAMEENKPSPPEECFSRNGAPGPWRPDEEHPFGYVGAAVAS